MKNHYKVVSFFKYLTMKNINEVFKYEIAREF